MESKRQTGRVDNCIRVVGGKGCVYARGTGTVMPADGVYVCVYVCVYGVKPTMFS